ncbi:hypothetical protein V0M98_24410 [Pseudomonas silesiensis]|uniref:hypothetical protein n=1 Tax=Pseudomonas silesiensis TaxID=1853130 RepID=UPI0030CAF3FC
MKMWIAVIALAGTLTSGMVEADPSDGNTLLKACRLAVKHGKMGQIYFLNSGVESYTDVNKSVTFFGHLFCPSPFLSSTVMKG